MSRQAKLLTLWLVVLFFVGALWGGGVLIRERIVGEEHARAEAAAALRASAVVTYTEQHLHQVRALLSAVRQFHAVSRSAEDTQRFIDGLGFDRSVIENIYLIDAEGRVLISHTATSGQVVADRDYFAFHRDPANRNAMHVSKVEMGRVTGQLHFRVSMRVNAPDGQFGGVVLATIQPSAFNKYFQQLNQDGTQRVVVLMGTQDRTRRARLPVPRDDQWPEPVEAELWQQLPTQAKGTYQRTSSFDQVPRTYVYEALAEWPLVAAVAFSQADVAAQADPRIRQLLVPAVGATVFVLMLALVATAMVVSHERLARAKQQVDDLYAQMRARATHDHLTGLPNRSLFFERLSRELSRVRRANKPLALLFLDLDGFKQVNDQHGHDAGDAVLVAVAQRWLSAMRDTDTVARLGGDEFAVILPHTDRTEDLQAIATKLIQLAGQAIELPDHATVKVGVSVGISLYPAHGTEIDTLMAAADTAMYQSKGRGKNRYTLAEGQPMAVQEATDWVVFTDAHLTGIPEVDQQHRELVRLVNEINRTLAGAQTAGQSSAGAAKQIKGLLGQLFEATRLHFETENRLMAAVNYPGRPEHEQAHAHLLGELVQMQARLSEDGEELLLQTLKDWLMHHIEHSDRALGAYVAGLSENNS
ncbi:MAG TPA: bacteriohemerythrin [Burkholderiaceae bacterium]|nr:bacteriohemerythrin [Burkholderiaceae bacterium]